MTLQCETAQTPSTVIWLKGHTELKAGGRYEMFQKEGVLTLTIKHLEEKDTDIYTCDVGTAKSAAKLIVNGKNLWMYVCKQVWVRLCLAELIIFMHSEELWIIPVHLIFSGTERGTVYGTFFL